MNKQELIEELENRKTKGSHIGELGINSGLNTAIDLAKQLDEPKKVVVPKFVAEWIKYAKRQGYGFMQSYDPKKMFYPINDGLDKWINDNEETFAHAWLDGYEVMKEPLYYVKMPLTEWNDDTSELETKYVYLTEDITSEEIRLQASNAEHGDWKVKLTEERVKSIDERYWPFAVKVGEE